MLPTLADARVNGEESLTDLFSSGMFFQRLRISALTSDEAACGSISLTLGRSSMAKRK